MSAPEPLRVLVMGAVKHDYILHGMAAHPSLRATRRDRR